MDKEYKEAFLKYDYALQNLLTELNILLKDYEEHNKINPVEHIKSRVKTKESALEKLTRKGYPSNYENMILHVHDMVGDSSSFFLVLRSPDKNVYIPDDDYGLENKELNFKITEEYFDKLIENEKK